MYRIKAPKGDGGYWVPILANPDIVEHYSENVVDTLHKKNLLLLGEDRYLTTLLLKTFPKRKNMFCPQAVCKTIVPDTFRVLLSQRRRWINSTVHNLCELVFLPELFGFCCFSMRFFVFIDLLGTPRIVFDILGVDPELDPEPLWFKAWKNPGFGSEHVIDPSPSPNHAICLGIGSIELPCQHDSIARYHIAQYAVVAGAALDLVCTSPDSIICDVAKLYGILVCPVIPSPFVHLVVNVQYNPEQNEVSF